jgi:hypothetical protein
MENQRGARHLKPVRAVKALMIVSAISVATGLIASHADMLESFSQFSRRCEYFQLDEFTMVCIT